MIRSRGGFTLVELLVALAVFAVMATLAYAGLQSVLRSRSHADASAARLQALQSAVLLVERDLAQAVDRPVRDELGGPEPAFTGTARGPLVARFTRTSTAHGAENSGLQRIEYHYDAGVLERREWETLDRSQGARFHSGTLLADVASLELRFLGRDWNPFWPPANAANDAALPRAVELVVVFGDGTRLRRLFAVTG